MSNKLYFRYGCMDSSKSLNLLATAHNYETQGKRVVLLKPSLDIRSLSGKIESRAGLSKSCIDILQIDNISNIIGNIVHFEEKIHCILIDESQFLTSCQVKQLVRIIEHYNIPIICYGLKNSYIDGELFEGSQALLYYADKIEEIKTVCSCPNCNKKAIMNLRVLNGEPVYSGEVINCGDTEVSDDYYIPVCRKHYFNPDLNS
jgi:thymidine kinase